MIRNHFCRKKKAAYYLLVRKKKVTMVFHTFNFFFLLGGNAKLLLLLFSSCSCSKNHVWLFAKPWTTAYQASLSFTIPQSLLKLKSTESVMPSNHLILCRSFPLLPSIFPSIRVFFNESAFVSGGQRIEASASVLLMNIQGWFPLGLTVLISLLFKGLWRVFSSTTVRKHQFFSAIY